jgi:hypothetical protein
VFTSSVLKTEPKGQMFETEKMLGNRVETKSMENGLFIN